jgi:hypothetical protein
MSYVVVMILQKNVIYFGKAKKKFSLSHFYLNYRGLSEKDFFSRSKL